MWSAVLFIDFLMLKFQNDFVSFVPYALKMNRRASEEQSNVFFQGVDEYLHDSIYVPSCCFAGFCCGHITLSADGFSMFVKL